MLQQHGSICCNAWQNAEEAPPNIHRQKMQKIQKLRTYNTYYGTTTTHKGLKFVNAEDYNK